MVEISWKSLLSKEDIHIKYRYLKIQNCDQGGHQFGNSCHVTKKKKKNLEQIPKLPHFSMKFQIIHLCILFTRSLFCFVQRPWPFCPVTVFCFVLNWNVVHFVHGPFCLSTADNSTNCPHKQSQGHHYFEDFNN